MAPTLINFQGLVDIHGPKPCKFIGFGDITRPHLEGRPPFVLYFRLQTLGAVLQCRDMTQLEAATSTAQYFMILVGGGLPTASEAPPAELRPLVHSLQQVLRRRIGRLPRAIVVVRGRRKRRRSDMLQLMRISLPDMLLLGT